MRTEAYRVQGLGSRVRNADHKVMRLVQYMPVAGHEGNDEKHKHGLPQVHARTLISVHCK